jgi:TonB family protein
VTLLIALALRSSVILAIGLVLSACLKKRSAALRHRVLAASLLAAVLVIPFSVALPAWTVTVPARVGDASLGMTSLLPVEAPASGGVAVQAPAPARTIQRPAAPDRILAAPAVFPAMVLAWLAGVLVAGGTFLAGMMRVSRVAARASRVEDGRWLQILDSVAGRYGLTRDIVISRTDSADLLATWGIRRPQVLLPDHALDWTLDRVHVVLCHELAHIRRHDWLVQMGAEALRAIFWCNPLAWMVCTRLRRESEQACDDEVLGIGVGGPDYAVHLLELARRCRLPGSTWASAMPMAHPSTLERRIAAMLNPRLDRQAPSRRAMAALVGLLLLVTLPAASLRARQAAPAPLTGTVYDATGGVLPGVQVALVDGNQNRWAITTNTRGRFELPTVGPGTYVLEVKLVGFRTLREEFELGDARDWNRAVTLQVGELSETISISASRATAPQPAPPRTGAVTPIRVGGSIRVPRIEERIAPMYPAAMREAGLSGVVPVQAVIGQDGTVSSVRVLSAQVHPDFAIAAVDAVRQWRFTPTLLNGKPVDVMMTVTVRFDLD